MAYATVTQKFKRYPWTDVTASPYNCDSTGVVDIASGIEQLKSDQSNTGTIRFTKGTYKVSTNLTIPSGMLIDMDAAAYFSVDAGKVLLIECKQTIHAKWFGTTGAAIQDAVDSCGSSNKRLVVDDGTWAITSDITIPDTIVVEFAYGCVLDISAGITFTVSGRSVADYGKVESGLGTLKYGITELRIDGSPEGVISAKVGSRCYLNDASSEPIFYIKVSGDNTNTLWSAMKAASNFVATTGDQSVGGVKTYTSFPVTPSSAPTTDYQVANKKYVDDEISGASYHLLQYVHTEYNSVITCSTTLPFDDTIPQNTEGDEVMTQAITPVSASSILIIEAVVTGTCGGTTVGGTALFVDSTANAICAVAALGTTVTMTLRFSVASGSTAARTYKIRCGVNLGGYNFYFNGLIARFFGDIPKSSISIMEVLAS